MRAGVRKILVTGGAGFIGSAFCRLLWRKGADFCVVDALNYAADSARFERRKPRLWRADIADYARLERVFARERPRMVAHFAAQTHVDRSIKSAQEFIRANVVGTEALLSLSKEYGVERFLHVSTDEVYGDILRGKFREDSPVNPSSPYSASKAAADLLVRSYVRTYAFPAVIVRPCNNYGPWQYPEKFIPRAILMLLLGKKIPIFASGRNVREWLYVEDCAQALLQVLRKGRLGEVYNLGSGEERENISVAADILKIFGLGRQRMEFVPDRPGHDVRYSLDSAKLRGETGWQPKVRPQDGLRMTVNWCVKHKRWLLAKAKEVEALYRCP
jgi:dTDP-glucose 4,6-dehydratase